jgi:hypothetical protein
MENFNTIEKGWIASLNSPDVDIALQALYEIRNSGSIRILPVLFGMINSNTNQLVRNEIIKLISEIKSREIVPMIISSFETQDYGDYLPVVVAACWQSGHDFSKHLKVFAGLFIQYDYTTALEAFTVIEESIPNASESEIYECIHFLKEAECMVTDAKLALFKELRKVVESA